MAVKLHSGLLRSVVNFKVNLPVAEGAGYEDEFFDYGSTRGYLKRKGAGRNLVTGELESNNYFELYIRYQAYYARVDLRIVIDGRTFTVHTVETVEEGKNQYLVYTIAEKK